MAPDGAASGILTLLFLLISEVFWPAYAPLAAFLIEPDPKRRRFIGACLVAGVAVAAWLLWVILTGPHEAVVRDGHIVYLTRQEP